MLKSLVNVRWPKCNTVFRCTFIRTFKFFNVWYMRLIFNNYLSAKTILIVSHGKFSKQECFKCWYSKQVIRLSELGRLAQNSLPILISTYAFPINSSKNSFQSCGYNDSFVGLFNAEVLYKASSENRSHYSVIIVNYTSFLNHYPKSRRLEKRYSMQ